MELRTSSFEHKELVKAGSNVNSVAFTVVVNAGSLDFITITEERVGMGLTVNDDTRPLMLDDINEGTGEVVVLLQNVFSNFLTKDFNVIDIFTTLSDNVDSVLTSVYV